MNKYGLFFALIVSAVYLSGCSNLRNTLGLNKNAPDEFSVITRAPLEMPKSLVLPPPDPGAPRPQEKAANEQAKEAVFGKERDWKITTSKSENILLQKAAARDSDPDIRAKIDKETKELQSRNKAVAEKLLKLTGKKEKPSASVVDAKKEFERIQGNIKEGKSITEGQTPVIEE